MMIRSAISRNGKHRRNQDEANRRKTNKTLTAAQRRRFNQMVENASEICRGTRLPRDAEVR